MMSIEPIRRNLPWPPPPPTPSEVMPPFPLVRFLVAIFGYMFLAITIVACLVGCSNYDKARECQRQAGPTPHPVAAAFGLIGAAWSLDQPDTQAYNRAVDACMQEARQ